nr:neurogenic locus notch homolog protein 1-like isoform X2 [Parasteatoda tepidariorum]
MKTIIISIFLFIHFFAVVKGKDDITLEDVSIVVNGRNGIALLKNQSAATDPCSPNPCQNNQTCKAKSGGKFRCSCKLPFKGDLCEKSPCNPNPCKNDGNCSISYLSAKCSCLPGYKGDICTVGPCSSNPCQNGGTCKENHISFNCICLPQYTGNNCELKDVCYNRQLCKNGGSCITTSPNKFKCICKAPYSGSTCQVFSPCKPNPCQNGGTCNPVGNTFKCQCKEGFGGDQCDIRTEQPDSTDSSGRTDSTHTSFSTGSEQPDSTDSSGSTGWTDTSFSTGTEQPYSTDSSGSTDWTDTSFSTGTEQLDSTDSSGSTDWTDTSFSTGTVQTYSTETSGSTGWTDTSFSTGTEQPDSTDSSGSTDWTDTSFSTGTEQPYSTDSSGSTDWTDTSFSTAGVCDCGNHSVACYLDNEGKKMCICDIGYSQLFHTCIDCYCGEKSLGCFFDESKEKKCLCKEGYAQDQEACRETCKYDRECLNGGICKISYGRVGFCECRADNSGDRCEINDVCDHFNDVCQRYGAVCVIKDGLPSCECPSDRKGVTGHCENICNPDKCIHGRCEIFGKDFKCRCEAGFEGKYCDSKRDGIYFILVITGVVLILIFSIGVLCMAIYFRLKKKPAATDLEKLVNDIRTETISVQR